MTRPAREVAVSEISRRMFLRGRSAAVVAAGAISMGLTSGPGDLTGMGTENYLPSFPYLGTPHSGFTVPSGPA
jgi:hypothetical protein